MNDASWARTYTVILALAAVSIPIATGLASYTVGSTNSTCERVDIELPRSTRFFTRLGPTGIMTIGVISLMVVLAMSLKRNHFSSVIVSLIVLAASLIFLQLATVSAVLPFIDIGWGLR